MTSLYSQRLGILSGLGPVAGAYALSLMLRLVQQETRAVQDDDYPDIVLQSRPLQGFGAHGIEDDTVACCDLTKRLDHLVACGADCILMACNSIHVFLPQIDPCMRGKIVDFPMLTAKAVHDLSVHAVGVISSHSSQQHCLYETLLLAEGCNPLSADNALQEQIDGLIVECMAGRRGEKQIAALTHILTHFEKQGADAVVIGCTEISWLASDVHCGIPVIDSLAIGCHAALQRLLRPINTGAVR